MTDSPVVEPLQITKGERWTVHRSTVLPEWIDYNGHMNVAYYVLAFDVALDAMYDLIGLTPAYRERHDVSTFALEAHVCYLNELKLGDPLRFEIQMLGLNTKRFHYINCMFHDDTDVLCATAEWISAHMDMKSRRMAPFRPDIGAQFRRVMDAHNNMPKPDYAGRVIGIGRR